MALVVQCYHCNTILELDEGFRGGVCRCSTCGSLLQVPKASSRNTPKVRPAAPVGSSPDVQRPASPIDAGLSRGALSGDENQGSGLRTAVGRTGAAGDLGGSSSGLRRARPAAAVATAPAPPAEITIPVTSPVTSATRPGPHLRRVRRNNVLLYAGLALVAIITLVVVIVGIKLVLQQETPGPVLNHAVGTDQNVAPAAGGSQGGNLQAGGGRGISPGVPAIAPQPKPKGFLGVPLTGKKIVLSIDAASSMNDYLDYVRSGVYHAIASLEPGQEIRIALWKGHELQVLPAGFVSKTGLKDLQQQFDAIGPTGASDAEDCMKASLALGADQVIFVTAKVELDPQIADDVAKARVGAVRLDGIKIESADDLSPLEILAKKTGGTYRLLSTADLEQLTQ